MDEIDPLCRLEIRVAKRRDVLEMNRLNREALPENYPLSYWREQVAHKNSFVANRKSVTYGYVLCDMEGGIISFAVDKAYRGLGLGKRLLQTVITHHRNIGIRRLTLQVRVSNTPAISLYKICGFTIVGQHRGYYEDGENAYRMVCEM
jgi:ribosomal-protein-alanine N-acetyltransferase